jgi:hypothetical protein
MRHGCSSVRLLALAVLVVFGAFARAGDVPPSLVEKYEPAVEKLQGLYSHATVTGKVRREFPLKKETFEQTYTLRAAGQNSRLDINTITSKNGGPPVGTVEVYMATPDASFYGTGRVNAPAIDTSNEPFPSTSRLRLDRAARCSTC